MNFILANAYNAAYTYILELFFLQYKLPGHLIGTKISIRLQSNMIVTIYFLRISKYYTLNLFIHIKSSRDVEFCIGRFGEGLDLNGLPARPWLEIGMLGLSRASSPNDASSRCNLSRF